MQTLLSVHRVSSFTLGLSYTHSLSVSQSTVFPDVTTLGVFQSYKSVSKKTGLNANTHALVCKHNYLTIIVIFTLWKKNSKNYIFADFEIIV